MLFRSGSIKGALWIPAQALFEAEGRKYVHLRSATGFTTKDVEMVRRSESQVVIKGLAEGQMIALANPDQSQQKDAGKGALQALPKK